MSVDGLYSLELILSILNIVSYVKFNLGAVKIAFLQSDCFTISFFVQFPL
jgi:hypothetical protein